MMGQAYEEKAYAEKAYVEQPAIRGAYAKELNVRIDTPRKGISDELGYSIDAEKAIEIIKAKRIAEAYE